MVVNKGLIVVTLSYMTGPQYCTKVWNVFPHCFHRGPLLYDSVVD
jgi:hypothetical protein